MRNKQENPNGPCRTLIARSLAACFLVIGLLAGAATCSAQVNETGTINGTVTDSTGAVIPGAVITIINVDTKTETTTKTNGAGDFSMVGLNVGHYSVKVMLAGFETYEKENFYLGSTQTYTVNVSMKTGSDTRSIVVQADAVHVETGTNEISSEISGEEANMLALGGRNYQQLSTLMPGVTNLSAGNSMGTGGYLNSNAVSVNGMGRTSVFYTLDGIWNQELGDLLTNTVTPAPEAIAQVKLLQNNYGVQYNMMGGAVFMVHTKEGTSSFHGQAWYFYRDGKFNAKNYFVLQGSNPPFNWNIGGVGLGGPLFVPHIFNTHKDKTFFYINGQYVHQDTYAVTSATAPTVDETNGIFPAEIHDPVTSNDYPSSPGGPKGIQWTIPQSKIVPAAQALLKALVPAPNTPASCPLLPTTTNIDIVCLSTGNYVNNKPVLFKQLNLMGKVDEILTPRLHVTAEYFREGVRNDLASAARMGSLYPNNWDTFYNNDSVAQIHVIQTLSSSMVNQTSISMDRYIVSHTYSGIHLVSQVPGFSEQLAYPSTIIGLPGQWLPDITFSAGWTPFGANSNDTQWRTAYLAEALTDNWNWQRGKHNFAAGGTFVLGSSRINAEADNTSGTFNFNGNYTGTPIADFLTGFANQYIQGNTVVRKRLTYPIYSPYAEDQWKILPRLTLTLGVRYSYMPFATADQGFATAFNPASFVAANAPMVDIKGNITPTPNWNPVNGLVYNGLSGVPFNLSNAHKSYVSPSAGFAWDLYGDGKSSLRGGFSINYLKSGSSSDCEANCIGLPIVNQIELSGANFPNPLDGQTSVPTAVSVYGEDMKHIQAAEIYSYSLSVQQQFGPNWIAEFVGAGIAGRKLPLELNVNQPLPIPGYDYDYQLGSSGAGNTYYAPYKGYNNILYATSTGIANWNALELNLRHPVGRNIVMRAAFTWAHGLSNVPGQAGYAQENSGVQDSYHPMRDYGSSPLNQDLNFSSSLIYRLPWFTPSGWTKRAFGDWSFSAVVSLQNGLSMTPGLSSANHGLTTRPNVDPTVPYQRYHGSNFPGNSPTRVGPFFSTDHFVVPDQVSVITSSGMFGNAPTGAVRGPGTIVNDVALFKSFQIRGEFAVRVRGELFNMVNHPNFNGEDMNKGDTNFGYYTKAADPREAEFAFEVMW